MKRLIVSDLKNVVLVFRVDLTSVNVLETKYTIHFKLEGPQGKEDIFVPRKNVIVIIKDQHDEDEKLEEEKTTGKINKSLPVMLPVLM